MQCIEEEECEEGEVSTQQGCIPRSGWQKRVDGPHTNRLSRIHGPINHMKEPCIEACSDNVECDLYSYWANGTCDLLRWEEDTTIVGAGGQGYGVLRDPEYCAPTPAPSPTPIPNPVATPSPAASPTPSPSNVASPTPSPSAVSPTPSAVASPTAISSSPESDVNVAVLVGVVLVCLCVASAVLYFRFREGVPNPDLRG